MKKNIIFAIIFIILSVILVLTPDVVAPVCGPMPDGKFMKCHWMGQSIKGIAIGMIILGVILIFIKSLDLIRGIVLGNIVLGISAISQIYLIGGCKMPDMACRAHTIPAIYLITGLYIVCSIYYLISNKGNKQG